jgi:hypothetical protein
MFPDSFEPIVRQPKPGESGINGGLLGFGRFASRRSRRAGKLVPIIINRHSRVECGMMAGQGGRVSEHDPGARAGAACEREVEAHIGRPVNQEFWERAFAEE